MRKKWAMVMFSVVTLALLGGVGALIARADPPSPPSFEERQTRALESMARSLDSMAGRCR